MRPAIQAPGWRPNPSQIVLMAFCAFIVVGTLLLALPAAHADAPHQLVDDFFIAASAVCVTGLVTLDPATQYSLFGQTIIMVLIQVGGLGYMTLFTVSLLLIGRRLSMRDRIALHEATDQPGMAGLIRFIMHIIWFTLAVEGLGFVLLAFLTVPEFGWGRGLFLALFHSISAFNNAGFSLFSDGAIHWQGQGAALLILTGLLVIGGLGYTVNRELVNRYLLRRPANHHWDVLMRIVLVSTAVLLIGGTLLFWLFEASNPKTLGPLPWHTQAINAFFMAAQPRTAGFNSFDMAALTHPTLMMTMVLMLIGAGPGGTAGGIKLTTVAIMLAAILSAARGDHDVPLFNFKRTVSEKQVRKALTVMTVSLAVVVVTVVLLASIEDLPFLGLVFEATSAFATVGLSLGITAQLSAPSKLILVATMLIGRVGVLVLMLSFIKQRSPRNIHYMEEPLLIG